MYNVLLLLLCESGWTLGGEREKIRTAASKAHTHGQKDYCRFDSGRHLGNVDIVLYRWTDHPRRLDTVSPVYNDARTRYFQLLLLLLLLFFSENAHTHTRRRRVRSHRCASSTSCYSGPHDGSGKQEVTGTFVYDPVIILRCCVSRRMIELLTRRE